MTTIPSTALKIRKFASLFSLQSRERMPPEIFLSEKATSLTTLEIHKVQRICMIFRQTAVPEPRGELLETNTMRARFYFRP